jgi:general secretion pathway protein G
MKAKHGFTLVEILIVVVILGILAAIVIPQFTEASTEAKQSSLVSDLQTLRSQIELYKIQHKDQLPGSVAGVDFETAMTSYTNQDGAVQAGPGYGIYGPYMQMIPANPFNDLNTVTVTGTPGSDQFGWWFDPVATSATAGQIKADDDDLCTDKVTPHTDL